MTTYLRVADVTRTSTVSKTIAKKLRAQSCWERPIVGFQSPYRPWRSPSGDPLSQIIADGWTFFEDISSEAEVGFVVKTLKKTAQLPGIEQFTNEQIWAAVENHRADGTTVEQSDLKGPEWDALTAANPPTDYPHFMSKKVRVPKRFSSAISGVLLLAGR